MSTEWQHTPAAPAAPAEPAAPEVPAAPATPVAPASPVAPAVSTVVGMAAPAEAARRCLAYLDAKWSAGRLELPPVAGCRSRHIRGFTTYEHTAGRHNRAEQGKNTIVVDGDVLPLVRAGLPGFLDMEDYAATWLRNFYRLGALPVLVLSHVLRQGPATLGSTTFAEHRDNEENRAVAFSVIVKLSHDADDSPPSRMRLVRDGGAVFDYGRRMGSAAVFESGELHASVALPPNAPEVIKVAYFYRRGM